MCLECEGINVNPYMVEKLLKSYLTDNWNRELDPGIALKELESCIFPYGIDAKQTAEMILPTAMTEGIVTVGSLINALENLLD